MAPYKVALIPPKGDRLDLMVPFDGSKLFSDLVVAVMERASKYRSLPFSSRFDCLKLCLGSEDGFLVEPEDPVQDIMTASSDVLFIIFLDSPAVKAPADQASLATGGLQIRVITPDLACKTPEVRNIPLLLGGQFYNPSTTLREIRHDVAEHLQLPSDSVDGPATSECNCKLADLVVKRGEWEQIACVKHNIMGCTFGSQQVSSRQKCARCCQNLSDHDAATDDGICHSYILRRSDLPCGHIVHSQCLLSPSAYDCPASCYSTVPSALSSGKKVIVISGNSQIEKLDLSSSSHLTLMSSLHERFGDDFLRTKKAIFKGGLRDGESYPRLPVVAICASTRHGILTKGDTGSSDGPSRINLGIHTIEGPVTTHNLDLTLSKAGLADIAVSGVLTLYAVEWRSDTTVKKAKGLDGMFAAAAHWKIPSIQSDRGMAAVLSSLRVFAHIIGSEEFDDYRQNEVLRILHALTRFPPAVRAAHILMDGKTLQPNESAALVQSIAAVAQDLIPPNLIKGDVRRSLEGARLVLGIMLHNIRKPDNRDKRVDGSEALQTSTPLLPYISAYHTVDLRDVITLEPVTEPVLTDEGLVNKSVFDAFSVSPLLKQSPSCRLKDRSCDDSRRIRVALLYGGGALEIPFYAADILGAALERYGAVESLMLDLKSLSSDIVFLASLCEETRLVVAAPRDLSNVEAPSLTLDRYGYMAVYTGRSACAEPGHDHAVFHPLTGTEDNVDVTIVSQMLEPILQAREKDGTNVFDLFSATYRQKEALPTEMVVFCVDCSQSMNGTSDFTELNEDDEDSTLEEPNHDLLLDEDDDVELRWEDVKMWLCEHESYDDMLHLVNHSPSRSADIAAQVAGLIRDLVDRELASLAEKQRSAARWATYSSSHRTSTIEERMRSLRGILTGLDIHRQTLQDFLVFSAKDPSFTKKEFLWRYGDPLSFRPQADVTVGTIDADGFCIVPQEFICPISQGVFEDPVKTTDGFTFDRKAIERWFRIRKTSPLTGLPIQDTSLRHLEALSKHIKSWVQAEDVLESLPSTPKRLRRTRATSEALIDFVAPTLRFSRQVPGSATLLDLHKVAFRGMRGLFTQFSLYAGGTHLPPSDENIRGKGIRGNQTITISPNHTLQEPTPGKSITQEDVCLVRVYDRWASPTEELFSYWVPLHSELTVASVLFRHWRYCVEEAHDRYPVYDRQPWTDLRDSGDGSRTGWRLDIWSTLYPILIALPQSEVQPHEALFELLRDSRPNPNNNNATRPEPAESTQYDRHKVLKIQMGDYRSAKSLERSRLKKQKYLSRMAVTKQVFSQFINRLIAYNFPTHVGLVTFGTATEIAQPITAIIENFRQAVDKMDGKGDTALWDAISLSADHLVEMGQRYPGIRKRIICLSDGEDTTSLKNVEHVCRMLVQQDIVVDSVCIGGEDSSALRTVSYFTRGYKFIPDSIEEASVLCELEPVLSVHERLPTPRRAISGNFHQVGRNTVGIRADPVTRDVFPARKTHENLNDSFIQIGQMEKTEAGGISSASSVRARRLLQEIRDIANHGHPSYDVYVSESNMGFWKIVLQGPAGSAYANGTFVLYLDMGEDYPRKAPSGRFITPIFHPNINRHGRIW